MTQSDIDPLPCHEKITFESKEAAEATAITSQYWYGSRPRAYRCRHCRLWHLSTA